MFGKFIHFAHQFIPCLLLCFLSLSAGGLIAADKVKHQITGLFSRDREQDLRDVFKEHPSITLLSIDFENAEATFMYEAATVFPGAKPEQIVERFDNLLRSESNHTFGVKPLCTTPRSQLEFIEIRVAGLDCKACCLAAYESVYRIDGVEQATASFRDGLVTAWIHPDKTDRAALENALKQKGVTLVSP